ncbi:hypothetical protein DFP73DRAFT_525192 [Morchella snyderi]|nr:hypothetical protein DFP73DRAFT_525192 [Morchella snyderi]
MGSFISTTYMNGTRGLPRISSLHSQADTLVHLMHVGYKVDVREDLKLELPCPDANHVSRLAGPVWKHEVMGDLTLSLSSGNGSEIAPRQEDLLEEITTGSIAYFGLNWYYFGALSIGSNYLLHNGPCTQVLESITPHTSKLGSQHAFHNWFQHNRPLNIQPVVDVATIVCLSGGYWWLSREAAGTTDSVTIFSPNQETSTPPVLPIIALAVVLHFTLNMPGNSPSAVCILYQLNHAPVYVGLDRLPE